MKFRILFLVLLTSLYSSAQKCVETADPITNEKSVEYKYQFEHSHVVFPYYPFQYRLKNGKLTFEKEFSYDYLMKATAPAGTVVYFKLENGTIMELKTVKEAQPKVSTVWRVVTSYEFVFELSKADVIALSESPLVLIRLPKIEQEGFIDWDKTNDIFKRNKKPIQQGADCIKGYMN